MSALAVALLALLAAPARAQTPLEVRRGTLEVRVKVGGTVVAADTLRLKSTIDGRVEELDVSTYAWFSGGHALGYLASKEMAAIYDSHNTTEKNILGERWKAMYDPSVIRCPSECFVLRVFVKPQQWVKPQAVLIEAARELQMVGRVRPEHAHLIRDGQTLEYWDVNNPLIKYRTRVSHYVLDLQGSKFNPGGTFTMDMPSSRYLNPGTEWEGIIVPTTKKGVLVVPTGALIQYGGEVYLPVRVSTGITTDALTEISAGTEDKREILVLDDARLKGGLRYRETLDKDAVEKRIREEYLKEHPAPKTETITPLPEPGKDYGEDPYSE